MDKKELVERVNKVLEIKEKKIRVLTAYYDSNDYAEGYNDCLEQVREILEGTTNEH